MPESAHNPAAEEAVIRVTATDIATGESDSHEIRNDYVLVTAGDCEVTNFQVHAKSDGTATHVITVKGVRRG